MGLLNQYREEISISKQSSNTNGATYELALKSVRLEDGAFVGEDLLDGTTKRVIFRDYKQKEGSKYSRPEQQDIVAKSKNGIVRFESCFDNDDGTISSRWAKPLTNRKGDNTVVQALASIYYGKTKSDIHYVRVTVVFPEKKAVATNLEDFIAVYMKLMESTGGSQNAIYINLIEDNGDKLSIFHQGRRENIDGNYVMLNAEQNLNQFKETDQYKSIESLLNSGKIRAEIIPARTLYVGPEAKNSMLNGFTQEIMSKKFKIVDENGVEKYGFLPCVITTKKYYEGEGSFVVDIAPIGKDQVLVMKEDL